ncbi:MAG: lytic transglycosylase domain-containing protein [Gammaproteobacteria bacterium]|nr:MAG: lytic transglycosylase domain-containing protein [Gammaproteobacteria bacterium]
MQIGIKIACLCPLALVLALLISVPAHSISTEKDSKLRQLLKNAIESNAGFEDRFDAEVWLLDMSNRLGPFISDPEERLKLLMNVHYEAKRVNLAPELVLALIEVESHFDKFAISISGARGLMQIMPFWLDEIGISDKNLFKIRTNLRMGCTILRYYMDMESNDLMRALARYNGSLGSQAYPNKIIKALNTRWFKQ